MCVSLVHYGKHIITDMINFSNPGKVEMYGHSRGVLQYILFFIKPTDGYCICFSDCYCGILHLKV